MFKKRLKAVDLARGTNIAPSVISRYLSGQNQPSRDNIITIGNYLDTHPQSLLSSSDAPESIQKSQVGSSVTEPLLKTIEVQDKLIKNLEKQVADWEKTLENTITPDETTKKLFNLLDQLMFVAIGGSALCKPNDRKGNDLYEGVRQGIDKLSTKIDLIKARFFTEEEIEKAKMGNMSIAHSLTSIRKTGRPRKKKNSKK